MTNLGEPMRSRARVIAAIVVSILVAAACGNSSSSGAKVTGGPGIDTANKQIRVAVITTGSNPIGGKYSQFADGVQAYFDKVNQAGGINGYKLTVVKKRDDQIGLQNVQQVQASLAEDNAFATFLATLQFGGADLLAQARQPTFIWNINPEMATPANGPSHDNIFANVGALCFSCAGYALPWLATKLGFTKVAVLAYSKSVSAESGKCAEGQKNSYAKYTPNIKVAFYDDSLPFAADIKADVSKMKDAGVQLIGTCLDTNEVTKLAKEMKTQGLNAIQSMANAYDHDAIGQSGGVFDGSYIALLQAPWEAVPQSAATKEYLDWVHSHNIDPVEVTEYGWIDAWQFVDGLKAAGKDFTNKEKVIAALNKMTAESPGGLVVPLDWTKYHNDPQTHPEDRQRECFVFIPIQGSKFGAPAFTTPDKPWLCFPADHNQPLPQDPEHVSFAPGGQG